MSLPLDHTWVPVSVVLFSNAMGAAVGLFGRHSLGLTYPVDMMLHIATGVLIGLLLCCLLLHRRRG